MQESIKDMSAHNEALIIELHWVKRALEQLVARVGRLEASINELMAEVGEVGKGAGGAGAVTEFPAP